MGPEVNEELTELTLKPFCESNTYKNLMSHPEGVFHITDDVLLLAQAAINRIDISTVQMRSAQIILGTILENTCRALEFRVTEAEIHNSRAKLSTEIVYRHHLRDFFGFNRAKHAVVEAAVLATRVHLLEPEVILNQFDQLRIPVEKTAGHQEQQAFALLQQYVNEALR